ncbi:MAG: universal stress protein [Leptolyngbyaceae cyanobacterium SM2_5_2]|nr:universal stress protein [Leptolyngbyaceae cyanobacterium SM2_5_2]
MFEAVLIALDHSPFDQTIMAAAERLKLSAQAIVVFVHVLPYPEDAGDQDVSRPSLAELPDLQIKEYLATCAQKLEEITPVIEVVQGNADMEIVRLANIHQVGLIVVGSRGLTGVDRILAGSVSSQVVEQAPCTVMVVKP